MTDIHLFLWVKSCAKQTLFREILPKPLKRGNLPVDSLSKPNAYVSSHNLWSTT